MELQPNLKGELVELRPLKAEDFDDLYAVASDPLIWELHPQPTRYKKEIFAQYFDKAMASGGALKIIDPSTNKIIGSSWFHDFNPTEKSIIIGFTFIARAYWGGQFNRDIKKAMLDHAFRYVETAIFHVGEKNFRSQKAMEKIGGVRFDRFSLPTPPDYVSNTHISYKIEKKNYTGDRSSELFIKSGISNL
jgi:N-acetyltransferase